VRDLVVLMVLGSSRGLAKWVRLPYLQIEQEERNVSAEICSQVSCKSLDDSQNFFLQKVFWLAGQVSHFGSGLFGGLDKLWREFEVVAAFEPCNRTNRTKTDSVLGTMWSPSYRIKCYRLSINFEQCTTNWRADDNKLSAQTVEARWHARAVSLRRVLLWMEQLHSHSIMTFEVASFGCCLIVATSSCNCNSSN
jgi:hypothetical protein